MTESEKDARVDLAAMYRLADHYGWADLIYNHLAARVPGEACFLIKPHTLMFREVRASSLVKVRLDGTDRDRGINLAGFTIHSAVLEARPDVNYTLHVHTRAGMAVSALKDGLRLVSQEAMQFHGRVSYHDFEGLATDLSEAERLAKDLGPVNRAMILRNHGLLTCGATPAEALSKMRYLVEACEIQLMLQGAARDVFLPPAEICEHAARQMETYQKLGDADEWGAYLRIADGLDASFRD
jgi:ribulose-5-phosphate 4-epimerase/fuculose-1-phosphate aldolase